MDRHEPEMAQSRFEHLVDVGWPVEPIEEGSHFAVQSCRGWRDKMNTFLADRPGDHLHGTGTVVAPGPYPDFCQAAAPRREQRCVPGEEPFGCKRSVIVAGSVEHHLDDALDVAVRWL